MIFDVNYLGCTLHKGLVTLTMRRLHYSPAALDDSFTWSEKLPWLSMVPRAAPSPSTASPLT